MEFARRARQDQHRGRTGDDDAGRGADRFQDRRARGHHGLFAIGRPQRVEVDVAATGGEPAQDLGDPLLQFGVEHEVAPAEPGDRGDGQIVGGRPQPTAGDDEVDALGGEEPQLRLDVGGPVTADGDVGEFDPEFQQPVGHPWAVEVLNPAGQHLGAGDDDACACTHEYNLRGVIRGLDLNNG